MPVKDPCGICLKSVRKNHKALQCDSCNNWIHIKCNRISKNDYKILETDETSWYCLKCLNSAIPFSLLDNCELKQTITGSNVKLSENIKLISKEAKDFFSQFPNFQINDENEQPSIHCQYYDINDFTESKFKKKSFSILHLNIASISAHIDDLRTLLTLLDHKFDIITISETRIKKGISPTTNIELEGYTIDHTPTEASVGGVLIYMANHINFKVRHDLNALTYKTKEQNLYL